MCSSNGIWDKMYGMLMIGVLLCLWRILLILTCDIINKSNQIKRNPFP